MSYTLSVFDGTEVYTYTGVSQITGEPEISEKFGTEIEQASIQIQILNPTFLGVTSIYDLPVQNYRCTLTFDYSESEFPDIGVQEIINGRVLRTQIAHSIDLNVWIITLVDDATDELQRRLELQNLASVASNLVETSVVASDGGVDVANRFWYSLELLWRDTITAMTDVDFNYASNGPFFSLSIDYDVSGETFTITRDLAVYVTYTDESAFQDRLSINAMQLLEIMQSMLAWKTRARYGVFPSEYITADVYTDLNITSTNDIPEIDGLDVEGDEFLLRIEAPEIEDFALSYRNPIQEEIYATGGTLPPLDEIHATTRAEFTPDGEPANKGSVTIDMFVAQADSAVSGNTGVITPDAVDHPNYTETVYWARPMVQETGNISICSLLDVSGTLRMISSYQPVNPATGQAGSTAPHWATELFKNYIYSISELATFTGAILLDAILLNNQMPIIGDQRQGVGLYGDSWRVTSIDWDIGTLVARLRGDRPFNIPPVDNVKPFICPPRNIVFNVDVTSFGATIRMFWNPPIVGCGEQLPVEYELVINTPSSGQTTATVASNEYSTVIVGSGLGLYDGQIKSVAANGTKSVATGFAAVVNTPE